MRLNDIKRVIIEKKQGTFIGAKLDETSLEKLKSWVSEQKFDTPQGDNKYHCTIAIDKERSLPYDPEQYDPNIRIDPETYNMELFGPEKNVLVLTFDCPELEHKNRIISKKYKIDPDHDYRPHITLAYGVDEPKGDTPDFPIMFSEEYVESFDPPSLDEDILGTVPTLSVREISRKHGVSRDFIMKQLERGIEVEQEHTTDREAACEIALDHLMEIPDYYDRLDNMERDAGATDSNHMESCIIREMPQYNTNSDVLYEYVDGIKIVLSEEVPRSGNGLDLELTDDDEVPKVLFYASPVYKVSSIRKHGLVPGKSQGLDDNGIVFLSSNLANAAKRIRAERDNDEWAILQIRTDGGRFRKNPYTGRGPGDWFTTKRILPNQITLYGITKSN